MIEVSVNYPFDFTVVGYEDSYEGERVLKYQSGDYTFDVVLLRSGSDLGAHSPYVSFLSYPDNYVGGLQRVVSYPGADGLMPRNFFRPFKVAYKYNSSSQTGDFLGQSEKDVREYYPFSVTGPGGSFYWKRAQKNVRLFSFNGSLFMLSEAVSNTGADYQAVVNLCEWDEGNQTFQFVKRFDEVPVDRSTDVSSVQDGSPDYLVLNDEVYIIYRSIDEGKNNIVVWKSEDLVTWENVSVHPVTDTSTTSYSSFRLRAATDGYVVMVATLAVDEQNIGTGFDVEIVDFRSYLSFDNGFTFRSKDSSYRNVVEGASGNFLFMNNSTDAATYFFPNFDYNGEESFNGVNVKFDLYFDKNIGSFVILKGGDVPGFYADDNFPNECYLMGIKTVEGDYFNWEPCLKFRMDYNLTAAGPLYDDPYAPMFAPVEEGGVVDSQKFALTVDDVCVVEGDGVHDILLSVQEYKSDGPGGSGVNTQSSAVISGEFAFVEDELVGRGMHERIHGYGGKYHESIGFFCSHMSIETSSIVSKGYRHNETNAWKGPAGCRWREQLVATGYREDRKGYDFFAVLGPVSNMGERYGYQNNYTYLLEGLDSFGWESFTHASASYVFSRDIGNTVTVDAAGEYGYFMLPGNKQDDNASRSPLLYAFDTPIHRAGKNSMHNFKIRFKFKVSGGPTVDGSEVEIGRIFIHDSPSHTFVKLNIVRSGSGYVFKVVDIDSNLIFQTAEVIDLSQDTEVVFGLAETPTHFRRVVLWWGQGGIWNHCGEEALLNTTSTEHASNSRVLLGIVSYTHADLMSLTLKDVAVSSYGAGYRPIYSNSYRDNGSYVEGFSKGYSPKNSDPYIAEPVRIYTDKMTLLDGSSVRFEGGHSSGYETTVYHWANSVTKNSSLNLMNGLVSSCYDFTSRYVADPTFEVVFRNEDRHDVDCVSLIGVSGVYGFTLKSGSYNEDTGTWTDTYVQDFTIPSLDLNVDSYSDQTILLLDQEFEPGQLRGMSLFVYHADTDTWEDHYNIVDNYGGIIKVDRAYGAFAGRTLRLMKGSVSYDVPEALGKPHRSHFAISFKSTSSASLRAVGEVVLGKWVDLSDYYLTMDRAKGSSYSLEESDQGLVLPEHVTNSFRSYDEIDLNFEHLNSAKGYDSKVIDLLHAVYKGNRSFPLILNYDEGQVTEHVTMTDGFEMSPDEYWNNVSVKLLSHNWYLKQNSVASEDVKFISISVDNTESTGDFNFTVSSVNFNDSGVTYYWDLGDGSSEVTGATVSHTYSEVGSYVVTCRAVENGETVASKQIAVRKSEPFISDYVVTSNPLSPTSGQVFAIEVDAVDTTSAIVDSDSHTTVYIAHVSGPALEMSVTSRSLYKGEVSFEAASNNTGDVTVRVYDDLGREKEYTFTIQAP